MSRPLRIEYPGAWYHVMNRGRRAESIFSDKQDYLMFIDLLIEISEMWKKNVAAYCLMPNHYHILLQTPDGNISRCMRHLNGVYTQRYTAGTDMMASFSEEDTSRFLFVMTAIFSNW